MPPFTEMAWPVSFAAPGPPRKTTSAARSSGSATPRSASEAAFWKSFLLNPSFRTISAVGVFAISDGVTTLTRTPFRFASIAATLLNMTIAAIAAPITLSPGVGTFAASEAMFTMLPPPCSRMSGSTTRVTSMGGSACWVRIVARSSTGMRWRSSGRYEPVTDDTATSICPNFPCTVATASCT